MKHITHSTTDKEIASRTREQLKDILVGQFGYDEKAIGKLDKQGRVDLAKIVRDGLIEQNFQHLEQEERRRQAQLAEDLKDENYRAVVVALQDRVEKLKAEAYKPLQAFKDEVAKRPLHNLGSLLEWKTVGVLYHTAVVFEIEPFAQFLDNEANTPTKTKDEFLQSLNDWMDEAMRRLVCYTDYRQNSTCPVHNIKGQEEFEAKQYMAKLLKGVLKAVDRDFAEGETDPKAMCSRHAGAYMF